MDEQVICYIDDCDSNLVLIEKAFSNHYQVKTLKEPSLAIAALQDIKPDLILLDVNMPEMDGYDLCRSIRCEPDLESVPVVFLTCRSGIQERLNGFEAGGDAYISKPFELSELNFVVRAHLERYQRLKQEESKVQTATNMAFTMMKNNSEIGQVVQYARAISNVVDEADLIQKTLQSLDGFGLSGTMLVRVLAGEIIVRSDHRPSSPIEVELLNTARFSERIAHVGNKYLFSGKHCAILVNNMPTHDETLTGRLRDHLAIMLESCDACIELINYRQQAQQQTNAAANRTQSMVIDEFVNVESMFLSFSEHVEHTFEKLTKNIEESFFFLGLTEEQESQLMSYIEEARRDNDRYRDYGIVLRDAMSRVAQSISQLTQEA